MPQCRMTIPRSVSFPFSFRAWRQYKDYGCRRLRRISRISNRAGGRRLAGPTENDVCLEETRRALGVTCYRDAHGTASTIPKRNLQKALGISVSPTTICRLLKSYGVTRKKIGQVATQRCDVLRGTFLAQCFVFTADTFVWIDESGSDARNHIRKFGYSIRGTTLICHRFLSRCKRTNAIAAQDCWL